MEKIKFTSDSICDLTPEILTENNIAIMPLYINMGDDSFPDQPGLIEKIYDFVDKTKTTPKTSAASTPDYQEFFTQQMTGYDALIHFNISGDVSSTHQNAVNAAKDMKNVYVIDSRSLTTGTGLQILHAIQYQKDGLSAAEIVKKIEAERNLMQCSFILKDLTYLHRGGRCSGTARLFATALHIKPQIVLQDGKMGAGKKFMGTFEGCVRKYVDYTLTNYPNPDLEYCFITHTKMDNPQIVEAVRQQILAKYPFKNVIETIAGATVTAHCGPNTLGVIYATQPNA